MNDCLNQEIAAHLLADVKVEYKHMLWYLNFASSIRGPHAVELRELFLEEAASEMKHVDEFTQQLNFCDTPYVVVSVQQDIPYITDPEIALALVTAMENSVCDTYALRIRQYESMLPTQAKAMQLFYEAQLEDSWASVVKLKQFMKKACNAHRA
jgi:bacterioferritin (cytochrome b1)